MEDPIKNNLKKKEKKILYIYNNIYGKYTI